MKFEIKSCITGNILFGGDFSTLAAALVAAVKNKTVLSDAVLRGADLRGVVLRGAVLRGADLRGVVLRGADLSGADLRRADLSDADLRRADLSDADLRGADLSGAVLSGADLNSKIFQTLPMLDNPDRQILDLIKEEKGHLHMGDWHQCDTTHCRAGWYVHKSGPAGRMLEALWGPAVAGAIIFSKAYPGRKVPNFYATDAEALADMKRNASEPLTPQ